MNWAYLNPFWREDRVMVSDLDPEQCRRRLKEADTSIFTVARLWVGRGDANFYEGGVGAGRAGSLFEMHVRVKVSPAAGNSSRLDLRFSGGLGSAVLMSVATLFCVWAFGWALLKLAGGSGWMPIYGAGLLSLLVPALLVLALRSEAPHDREELWKFVADQVEGRPA
ncbi:MAG: hypothetical protein E6J20_11540 [Chloroflexi bacterium]|nr:MAG: hypothetical protein E6J20_11540 [Chloroflexota bacterium]